MAVPTRVTKPLLDVLEVLLRAFYNDVELHGWAIMKQTRRSGPTVYGVLDRIEDAGWVAGRWERRHPEPNRPRRRFYRLTPAGSVAAYDLLAARRPHVLWAELARDPRRAVHELGGPRAPHGSRLAGGKP